MAEGLQGPDQTHQEPLGQEADPDPGELLADLEVDLATPATEDDQDLDPDHALQDPDPDLTPDQQRWIEYSDLNKKI